MAWNQLLVFAINGVDQKQIGWSGVTALAVVVALSSAILAMFHFFLTHSQILYLLRRKL